MDPLEILSHLSYVLLISASFVRTILPLRILAVGSGLASIAYGIGISDRPGILWESAFVAVNAVQIGILLRDRRRAILSEEESTLHKLMFPHLTVVDVHRLIRKASWLTSPPGDVLTTQGHAVTRIVLITSGTCRVEIDGEVKAWCKTGDFVGEMAFGTGNPASATVVAVDETRYLMWRFEDLRALIDEHPEIRSAMQSVFSRNLIDKLARNGQSRGDHLDTASS